MLKGWCKSTQVALPSRPLGKDKMSMEDIMVNENVEIVAALLARVGFTVVCYRVGASVKLGTADGEWTVQILPSSESAAVLVGFPCREGRPCPEGKTLLVDFLRKNCSLTIFHH
jgi:hypothetical protein